MEKEVKRFCEWFDEQLSEMFKESEGGKLRARKGKLVEEGADKLVNIAWNMLGRKEQIVIRRRMFLLPAPGNKKDGYKIGLDRQIYIGGDSPDKLVLCVECKAYAEVAMYKRVLLDCRIMKEALKHEIGQEAAEKVEFCLLLLESQLGGDFSKEIVPKERSPAVNAIDALFPDVNLEVLVLMDGERDINQPIHKEEFRKRLNPRRVKRAIEYFRQVLQQALRRVQSTVINNCL